MPPLLPAGIGCWTCRARRKKCDGLTPYCDTCERLGLECAGFDGARPPWMDGGDAQRDYCKLLTTQIKTNRRRTSSAAAGSISSSSSSSIPRQAHSSMPQFADAAQWSPASGLPSPGSPEDLAYWAGAYSMDGALATPGSYFPANDGLMSGLGDLDLNDPADPYFKNPFPQGMPAQYGVASSSSISSAGLTSSEDSSSDGASSHRGGERTDWTLIMSYFDEHFQQLFSMLRGKSNNEDIKAWLLARMSRSKTLRLVVMSVVLGLGLDLTASGGSPLGGTSDWGQFREVHSSAAALLEKDCRDVLDKHTSGSTRRKAGMNCVSALIHMLIIENSLNNLDTEPGHYRAMAIKVLKALKADRDSKKSGHEMERSEKSMFDTLAKMLQKPA